MQRLRSAALIDVKCRHGDDERALDGVQLLLVAGSTRRDFHFITARLTDAKMVAG